MLQHQKNRQPLTRGGWTLAAALAVVVSLPLAAVGIAPQTVAQANSPIAALTTTAVTPAGPPNKVLSDGGRVFRPGTLVSPAKVARPAQTSLTGHVQDQTGGRIPGATMTLTNQQTQESYPAVTNAAGAFQFVNLAPATYELVAELPGFRKVRVPIEPFLLSTAPANLIITLPLGALSEAITVVCKAPSPSILQMFFPTLSAQERPAAPIRVGGSVKPPRKIRDVRPVCPAGGVTGDVVVLLEGRIGVDGFITELTSLRPDDVVPTQFSDSANDAIRQWEFTPTLLNGVPVEVTITVSVVFKEA